VFWLTEALNRCNGDASAAALLLGLELDDFLRRLRKEGTA
jgi:transcriptional regulator with AAA-type ATPase domain